MEVLVVAPVKDGSPFLRPTYIKALEGAGLSYTVITPNTPSEIATREARASGGVLLVGGSDINPLRYGHKAHPQTQESDHARDSLELEIATICLKIGIPFLGICRGMQVLAVAAGGTLHQHLPTLTKLQSETHSHPYPSYDQLYQEQFQHSVKLKPSTDLYQLFGSMIESVPSMHHQAVAASSLMSTPLRASGWSPMGVVEVIERKNPKIFQIGVQGHFEANEDLAAPVFAAFARAIRART